MSGRNSALWHPMAPSLNSQAAGLAAAALRDPKHTWLANLAIDNEEVSATCSLCRSVLAWLLDGCVHPKQSCQQHASPSAVRLGCLQDVAVTSSNPPAAAAAATSLIDLPQPILVDILQRVPQRDRLTSCSLVCVAWEMAARRATTEITAAVRSESCYKQLAAWMCKDSFAASCTSLTLNCKQAQPRAVNLLYVRASNLPPQLRKLQLASCAFDMKGGCEALTHLTIDSYEPTNAKLDAITRLAAWTQLQHLSLTDYPTRHGMMGLQLLGGVLPALKGLTHFSLRPKLQRCGEQDYGTAVLPHFEELRRAQHANEGRVLNAALQHVSCLTDVQQLELAGYSLSNELLSGIAQLQHVTRLALARPHSRGLSNPEAVSQLSRLTALQHLQLRASGFKLDPTLLSSFKQLCVLQLEEIDMTSTRSFLQVLPSLEHLVHLTWHETCHKLHKLLPASSYSQLTASGKLQELSVCLGSQHEPKEEDRLQLEHIITSAQPQMRVLRLDGRCIAREVLAHELVELCPGLRELQLGLMAHRYKTDTHELAGVLETMQALSRLTQLVVSTCDKGGALLRNRACGHLAGSLRDLTLEVNFTGHGLCEPHFGMLSELTMLTGLTRLTVTTRIPAGPLTNCGDKPGPSLHLMNKVSCSAVCARGPL